MKRYAVLAVMVLLLVGAVLLTRQLSRKRVIEQIRTKWGPANPQLTRSEDAFEGKSIGELNWMLAKGAPGWQQPNTAGWQYA